MSNLVYIKSPNNNLGIAENCVCSCVFRRLISSFFFPRWDAVPLFANPAYYLQVSVWTINCASHCRSLLTSRAGWRDLQDSLVAAAVWALCHADSFVIITVRQDDIGQDRRAENVGEVGGIYLFIYLFSFLWQICRRWRLDRDKDASP